MEDHAIATLRSHTQQKLAFTPANKSLQLDSKSVRNALTNISRDASLQYLSDLFKGNGWTVAFTDADYSTALLLSDSKHPDTILLIVKFLKQEHELTYQEARDELIDFENNLLPKYQCSQFAIIALHGISRQAENLERFNLLLQGWEYIEELIKNYSTTKIQEPRIQLFAHNKQTYKKVQRMMKSCTSIAVVQATGTGKSFLIAKLLQDFTGEKRLVMAPSMYVIDQVKEHIRWDANNIEYMTYARSMNLSQSDIAALIPKMVVLDEFHRCGAEEWGRGVQNILNAYPNAFKLGTSATPVRYMDNARDMSAELFNNNVAENLSLAQAIVRNILPMPKYVCALYTLTEERDILKDKINRSRSTDALKKRMHLDLDTASIDWERGHGIPSILKKYLQPHMKKFIVFCKDEQHLLEMEPIVSGWFSAASDSRDIKTYRICDGEPKSLDNLKAFKSVDAKAAIHLLFSINMLNEGLHINEVSGVVLLRPTESPNIFYQQIGRCLKVGLNYSPVIFDLVNNFKSIRTMDFLFDLEFAHSQYASDRINENLADRCPAFTVMDEVREITEIFGEIKFRLDGWEAQFQRLKEYKELFGTCNVSVKRKHIEYRFLWHWLNKQKNKFKKGLLEPERRDKLIALDIDWKLDQLTGPREEGWENFFQQLCNFREKYGHSNVTRNTKGFARLGAFANDQRYRYKIGTLEEHRLNKLKSIGFEFVTNFNQGKWQVQFDKLVNYKNKYGHFKFDNTIPEYRKLGQWVSMQRMDFRDNKLDKGRMQKLHSIGFEWNDSKIGTFEKNFLELAAYYDTHKHYKLATHSKLSHFATSLRQKFKIKSLSAEHIRRLQAINFNLEFRQNPATIKYKRLLQLEEFFQLHGHSNVTLRNENYPHLYEWIHGQRRSYAKKLLSKEVIERMEAFNFIWDSKQHELNRLWNNQYNALLDMYQNTGTVIFKKTENNKSLHNWCSSQRAKRKRNELTTEQIEKLDDVGFKWEILEAAWEENFAQLAAFKATNGRCNASQLNPTARTLAIWSGNVRKTYQSGTLGAEKIRRLEAIGFAWNVPDIVWHINYKNLQKHLKKYGWAKLNKNKVLNGWINKQRKDYKANQLSKERIMRLNESGIIWMPFENSWNTKFEQFVKYRQVHGSSIVSHADKSHRNLWIWCAAQREKYRKNKIPGDQFKLLNQAGFEWEVKDATGRQSN